MTQQQDWENWRSQELGALRETIAWAGKVFTTTDVEIAGSRHYGAALLAQSIDCARAICLCIEKGLPGPAFALARTQYEGVLRGHIIIHEIDLEDLNIFLEQFGRWQQDGQFHEKGPPTIEIKGTNWKIVRSEMKPDRRPLQCEIANLFVGSVQNMGMLHDLAHSGMMHALQMRGEDGYIEANYSEQRQTGLLSFAHRGVMFSIMTWPGTAKMYGLEIERRVERIKQLSSLWDGTTPN